jgi:2-C-methyl-D-erythritol 2,4-cyclodiphosphate synthase
MMVRTGLGQDSHRFEAKLGKPLKLAGVVFEGEKGLEGNSDADVVLHALANAISSVTGRNVMGAVSDALCEAGITDSGAYVKEALKSLHQVRLTHVAVSLEGKTPQFAPKIGAMRESLAALLSLSVLDIGITATSGEGLTAFGQGLGLQALVLVTAVDA